MADGGNRAIFWMVASESELHAADLLPLELRHHLRIRLIDLLHHESGQPPLPGWLPSAAACDILR
jgi:hypothetical protein